MLSGTTDTRDTQSCRKPICTYISRTHSKREVLRVSTCHQALRRADSESCSEDREPAHRRLRGKHEHCVSSPRDCVSARQRCVSLTMMAPTLRLHQTNGIAAIRREFYLSSSSISPRFGVTLIRSRRGEHLFCPFSRPNEAVRLTLVVGSAGSVSVWRYANPPSFCRPYDGCVSGKTGLALANDSLSDFFVVRSSFCHEADRERFSGSRLFDAFAKLSNLPGHRSRRKRASHSFLGGTW